MATALDGRGGRQPQVNRRQQSVTFVLLFLGYSLYTMSRRGLSVASPMLNSEAGFTKTQIGTVSSWFTLFYGASKFIGGLASDKVSCKVLFAAGLFLAGLANMFAGATDTFSVLCVAWAVNGAVQGVGWPSLAKILIRWFEPERRGRVWAVVSMASNMGRSASPLILSFLVAQLGSWRAAFYPIAFPCFLVALACLVGLQDSPKEVNFAKTVPSSSSSSTKDDKGAKADQPSADSATNNNKEEATSQKYFLFALNYWLLCIGDIAIYFVRSSLADWSTFYLHEVHGLPLISCTSIVFAYELGGMGGTLSSGWLSDRLGGLGYRNITTFIYAAGLPVSLLLLERLPVGTPVWTVSAVMFCCGLFVNGPQTMAGISIRETYADQAGAAGGMLGLVGQAGPALSGGPVGYVIDQWGWFALLRLVTLFAVAAAVLFGLLVFRERRGAIVAPKAHRE